MSKQNDVLEKLRVTYYQSEDVLALLVYGSVAKGNERENSDIDLWVYKSSGGFVHRIDKIDDVKIDLFEISISMLKNMLSAGEAPAINALLEGRFLFNRGVDEKELRDMSLEAKKKAPIPIETIPRDRILNVLIFIKNLIDDARDLIDDKYRFRLVFSEVIVLIYNNVYDFYGIWRKSPKDTLKVFEETNKEIYSLLCNMLDDRVPASSQVESAEKILFLMAEKYGGIPDKHIITNIEEK